MAEKRDLGRRKNRLRVEVDPGSMSVFTGDVSHGGLFLNTRKPYRQGVSIGMTVYIDEVPYKAKGEVKWAKKTQTQFQSLSRGGMGVEFTWMEPALEAALNKILGEPKESD